MQWRPDPFLLEQEPLDAAETNTLAPKGSLRAGFAVRQHLIAICRNSVID